MVAILRTRPLLLGGAALALLSSTVLLWPGMMAALLRTDGYVPHGYCILWQPGLLWFHVAADTLIGLAYVAIAATLGYLVYRARRDIPFHWVLLAFGAFIIACGGTHFMEVWTFWTPVYWLSGQVKLVTAVASLATALALPPLVPRTLALIDAAKLSQERKRQLEDANQTLEQLYAQVTALDDLKTQFFANVSHELRTPLTLILGPLEQLLAAGTFDEQQQQQLQIAQRNAETLLRHVNDLLDVSSLDARAVELLRAPSDLAELTRFVASHFEGLAAERQVALSLDVPATLSVVIDSQKMQRVLLNLLSNAFKFTPTGGSIRVGLGSAAEGIQLSVDDSGPGVAPEQRELIFERFRQAQGGLTRPVGGSGLGLTIAREFVALHGGTLTVADSALGGARFVVALPFVAMVGQLGAARQDAHSTSEAAEARRMQQVALSLRDDEQPYTPEGDASDPLVLVVEDNSEMRRFIAAALQPDYRVAVASNGREGLTKALALRPTLILSDLMMPELSGDQLLSKLRDHPELATTPFVLLTAKADPLLRLELLAAGAYDYLLKPFSLAELRIRLANLLALTRARDALQASLASREQDVGALAAEAARLYGEAQQALRLRDEFLAVASHELKTPLTALLGNLHLLLRWTESFEETAREQRLLQRIVAQAERMGLLIEMLLDVSRIDRGQLQVERAALDLAALARQVVESIQPQLQQHRISLEAAEELWIEGDAVRLEQALHNLLSNAVKYSPDGGAITVRVERRDDLAALTVSDQGIGIPAAAMPQLFTRFYRAPNVSYRNISGVGIGLYVVQEVLRQHGGQIAVTSVEHQGSSFTLLLPLSALV